MQDEIFHAPQAAALCRGHLVHDPKITTPPGLYYLTLVYRYAGTFLNWDTDCSKLSTVRGVPFAALLALPMLLDAYLNRSLVSLSVYTPQYRALVVLAVATVPPLFFFAFLYYTDVPSTVLMLVSLMMVERRNHLMASLVGAVAITVRQNNVIWVAFALGQALLMELRRHTPHLAWSRVPPLGSLLRERRVWEALADTAMPYVLPLGGFAAFVVRNGGELALGDKTHHQVALHLAQLGYFFAFALFFGWPALLPAVTRMHITRTALGLFAALTVMGLAAVHWGTYVHPFLLADNRHYMFYVWRRIVDARPWTRYALVPLYVASGMVWMNALRTYTPLT